MGVCNPKYGLCGYSIFNGPNIGYPRNNGGGSITSGGVNVRRNRNGNINCHGNSVLGIKLQSQSLGNPHHWIINDCTNHYRRARFVLCVFYNSRSGVHFVDNLVFLEVETSS